MSIKGFFPTGFQTLPAPFVQAALFSPRLNLQGLINFMIDTGADNTTLSLMDVERLNVNYRRLKRRSRVEIAGFGGDQWCYGEEAIVILRDEDANTYIFPIDVHIPVKGKKHEQREQQRRLVSVLGRDVINQCKLIVNFHEGVLEIIAPEGTRLPVAMRALRLL